MPAYKTDYFRVFTQPLHTTIKTIKLDNSSTNRFQEFYCTPINVSSTVQRTTKLKQTQDEVDVANFKLFQTVPERQEYRTKFQKFWEVNLVNKIMTAVTVFAYTFFW